MAIVENQAYRARPDAGGLVERVLGRAQFLGDQDRTIVEMLSKGNLSRCEVARLVGISASALTRRGEKVGNRVDDPPGGGLVGGGEGGPGGYRALGGGQFPQGRRGTGMGGTHRSPRWG